MRSYVTRPLTQRSPRALPERDPRVVCLGMPRGNTLRVLGVLLAAGLVYVGYLRFSNGNMIQGLALIVAAGVALIGTFQQASR
jgi:hypothetical protein